MTEILFDPEQNSYKVLYNGSTVFTTPFRQMAIEFVNEFNSFLQL